MADIVDKGTRSRMMSGIRGKDTKPELDIRRALHARGFRFRLHARTIPGRPDLVLRKYQAVVFVHGCFWHRHENCRYATTPSTRTAFWETKFESNRHRDKVVRETLENDGWRVAIIWECALRTPSQVTKCSDLLATWLHSDRVTLELEESDTVKQLPPG